MLRSWYVYSSIILLYTSFLKFYFWVRVPSWFIYQMLHTITSSFFLGLKTHNLETFKTRNSIISSSSPVSALSLFYKQHSYTSTMEDTKMEDSSDQREMSHQEMPEIHNKGGLISLPFIIGIMHSTHNFFLLCVAQVFVRCFHQVSGVSSFSFCNSFQPLFVGCLLKRQIVACLYFFWFMQKA